MINNGLVFSKINELDGGTIIWPGGTEPTLTTTANRMDVFVFTTINGGAVWLGLHVVSDLLVS